MPRLNPNNSPHGARVMRLAERKLGDHKTAELWLEHPMHTLDARTLLEAAQTEQGAHGMEKILPQTVHWMLG